MLHRITAAGDPQGPAKGEHYLPDTKIEGDRSEIEKEDIEIVPHSLPISKAFLLMFFSELCDKTFCIQAHVLAVLFESLSR
ncbi:hypothetical protein J5N97_002786 [Dioscorea zingiberensis]|uniref:Uncharacterized protein n=1 Tax=Dioscorea zingiberensis TaxID=325984 RepID=A0A9D5D5G7_9LILI|nr:hypothetical protein J5N97_002786 [Dioscorea zingiberensis]